MSADWLPIEYRDFSDVPRLVLVRAPSGDLLLDCRFDEPLDDYPAHYEVYRLPVPGGTYPGDWTELPALGTHIGTISVDDVHFDPTRRRSVEARSLAGFVSG